ncbi:translation initiation factor IF-2, putative [Bodo saltans]|uniref:Translation initiation factor IF-2, putative n=1 Tax=Bodo saltans TaxID=75058 RepID=A0A0S4JVI9_BODSA|nr:translation initiation factor IF-2, putative [Bodo saltans]|eukprot:CUG92594.1 translation initiation factor IF-2, putative [Bodo saltans]
MIHHKSIRAAMGIKIAANDLEFAIPGTQLQVVRKGADREAISKEVQKESSNILADVDKSGIGVCVQSSTLGSLEALLSFLKDMKIPVAHVAIGPMYKRHMLPVVAMKGKDSKHSRYAIVLAFDTIIKPEAQELADQNGIEIFQARIIYHLFDMFKKHHEEFDEREKAKARAVAVFPVQLKILQAIRQADPIILGVNVVRGQLHPGTPLAFTAAGQAPTYIGKVESIQRDEKEIKIGKPGMDVSVKITSSDSGKVFGRHFTEANDLVSVITRASVDAVKFFKSEMTAEDTKLLAALMPIFNIRKKAPAPAAPGAAAAAAEEDE